MNRTATGIIGGLFILAAIALQHLFMGPAVIGLSIGLVVGYALWLATYHIDRGSGPTRLLLLYGLAVLVQSFHFLEEYLTGFQQDYPNFWGYEWSDRVFVTFNLAALGIFLLAGIGLLTGVRLSLIPVWVMAVIGGIGNGILHIGTSLSRGTYFPGSITAILHLVIGILLMRELFRPQFSS